MDLLSHAHVQIGAGHNTYLSGEEFIIDSMLAKILGSSPNTIFDVGANVGDYSTMIRNKFPNAKIYCFEPGEDAFGFLTGKKITPYCHNVAVGGQPGILTLYRAVNDINGSMTTAYKGFTDNIFISMGKIVDIREYEMITLDDFSIQNNIDHIDFLKIDTEGHELEILKGTCKMIAGNKIGIIQFEFNEFNIFSRSFMYDFYQLLPQYKFYRIMPQNNLFPMGEYNSMLEIFRYQNILAIHNSLNYVHRN